VASAGAGSAPIGTIVELGNVERRSDSEATVIMGAATRDSGDGFVAFNQFVFRLNEENKDLKEMDPGTRPRPAASGRRVSRPRSHRPCWPSSMSEDEVLGTPFEFFFTVSKDQNLTLSALPDRRLDEGRYVSPEEKDRLAFVYEYLLDNHPTVSFQATTGLAVELMSIAFRIPAAKLKGVKTIVLNKAYEGQTLRLGVRPESDGSYTFCVKNETRGLGPAVVSEGYITVY